MQGLASERLRNGLLSTVSLSVLLLVLLAIPGCQVAGTPPGAVVGQAGRYNYTPSVIKAGNTYQFWWCSQARNPKFPSEDTDAILYESIDSANGGVYGPLVVLAESPGKWDSAYTCNPKVVRGVFNNPLGDGQTYTYAMYYVGTALLSGANNSIGVAFSVDGIHWNKYPDPVVYSTTQTGYGVAQPTMYNSDHNSAIWLFYEDSASSNSHIKAVSTDGVHFTITGTLTTNGLDPNNPHPTWADIAYDSTADAWYAMFNLPMREPRTTGGNYEHGQYGFQLYRIASGSLLTGNSPWQQLKTVDTNLTGFECNFLPGFLRDGYGTVNVTQYPSIVYYPSFSNPQPAWDASLADAGNSCRLGTWDIGYGLWSPTASALLSLNRYNNGKAYEVTTGWIDPSGGFKIELALGHLYEAPQNGANTPFYGCKSGSMNYFVSRDHLCEGYHIMGLQGYGYAQPIAGLTLVPLYRCLASEGHFVSQDAGCEGATMEQLLGYALP